MEVKYLKRFCKMIPPELTTISKKIMMLKYDEDPPYKEFADKIRDQLANTENKAPDWIKIDKQVLQIQKEEDCWMEGECLI